MHASQDSPLNITRRHFFRDCGVGVGKIALASLLTDAFAARAENVPPANPLTLMHDIHLENFSGTARTAGTLLGLKDGPIEDDRF